MNRLTASKKARMRAIIVLVPGTHRNRSRQRIEYRIGNSLVAGWSQMAIVGKGLNAHAVENARQIQKPITPSALRPKVRWRDEDITSEIRKRKDVHRSSTRIPAIVFQRSSTAYALRRSVVAEQTRPGSLHRRKGVNLPHRTQVSTHFDGRGSIPVLLVRGHAKQPCVRDGRPLRASSLYASLRARSWVRRLTRSLIRRYNELWSSSQVDDINCRDIDAGLA